MSKQKKLAVDDKLSLLILLWILDKVTMIILFWWFE